MKRHHEMPFGAEIDLNGKTRFRLWAPAARQVSLSLETDGGPNEMLAMQELPGGWFELATNRAGAGSRYRFCIDAHRYVPDPASRYNPDEVHGASEVVDPAAFAWAKNGWSGRSWEEAVIYELHVGTFSPEGTFAGVQSRLDYLSDLGITAIELMPVAAFPGRRNWGYDGVLPYAPSQNYGRPEDLKSLVQVAHDKGMMIFLDVVYNHFGPEGNYLHLYAPQFFTECHHTPWGAAINFDGAGSRTVRDFFINNALYWLEEYQFDGLRLDAVHAIMDDTRPDILEELAEAVNNGPGRDRHIHLILENDHNAAHYLSRDEAGMPRWYAAQWNDDLHHALHLLATGESDGYYADYADGTLRHLARCLSEGFAYQGEASAYRGGRARGESSADLPLTAFVSFLQTHDQVGNRAFGERLSALCEPEALRAAVAIILLAPSPPLLFMGEEFGAGSPFLYFCDFGPELAEAVTAGRRKEFARFGCFSDPTALERIPDPNAADTFERSRLDWGSLAQPLKREWLNYYHHLLAIRAQKIVPHLHQGTKRTVQVELFSERGLQARWALQNGIRLLMVANLGDEPFFGLGKPAGTSFFCTSSDLDSRLEQGEIPPWTVGWFLETENGQRQP